MIKINLKSILDVGPSLLNQLRAKSSSGTLLSHCLFVHKNHSQQCVSKFVLPCLINDYFITIATAPSVCNQILIMPTIINLVSLKNQIIKKASK